MIDGINHMEDNVINGGVLMVPCRDFLLTRCGEDLKDKEDALNDIKDGINVVFKSIDGGIYKRKTSHDVERLISLEDGISLIVFSPLQ